MALASTASICFSLAALSIIGVGLSYSTPINAFTSLVMIGVKAGASRTARTQMNAILTAQIHMASLPLRPQLYPRAARPTIRLLARAMTSPTEFTRTTRKGRSSGCMGGAGRAKRSRQLGQASSQVHESIQLRPSDPILHHQGLRYSNDGGPMLLNKSFSLV
jgi:hypothetical protein